MDATPRFRLFDSRRGGGIDHEEGAAQQALPRRRMVTSVSVARARRRNRRRPGTHRGLALAPWLLSLSGAGANSRRRTVLLLLLAVCAAGAFVSARLLAWAASSSSSSSSPSSLSSSGSLSSPKSPRHASSSSSGDNADRPPGGDQKRRRRAVSLSPDAIPSVVLVERRPGGGARRASSLDAGAERDGEHSQPHRCRNTAQGAVLLADSEGRVCRRSEIDDAHRPGCCTARRPPFLPGGSAASDDNALAPKESYVDQDTSASRAAAGGITEVRGQGALELVALPAAAAAAAAAAVTAAAAERQPGGDGMGEDGFPPEQALSTPFSCWSCDDGGGDNSNGDDEGYFSNCCRSYEFCVSCCQAPSREQEREAIREAAARSGHPVYRELGLMGNDGGEEGVGAADKLYPRKNKSPRHHQLRGGEEGSPAAAAAEEEEEEEHQARSTREAAFAHCAFRCRTYSGSVAHENSYRGPLKHCFGRFRPPIWAPPGVFAVGAQGQAMQAGGGGEVVRNSGGQEAPPLQLDPFLSLPNLRDG